MPRLFGQVVMAIPHYRSQTGPALLSAVPLAECVAAGCLAHVHEMVFGFAAATVAGFLIPCSVNDYRYP